jgi:glycosyltransferase involved in cell wall biosynthesis
LPAVRHFDTIRRSSSAGSPGPRPVGTERELGLDGATEMRLGTGSQAPIAVKLSILMPVYNEAGTVTRAIAEILSATYPCAIELIVVDDGSTDGTWEELAKIHNGSVIVRRHASNCGKGAALLTAADFASGTHLLPFDADLEYDPEDIARVIEPVIKGRCDVVFGARLFGCNTVYQSYWYATGNRILTRIANVLFGAHISDLHTCLKLIPLEMLSALELKQKRFGLDTELTALLLRQGIRPFEVPISYYSRSRADGKKITWRDAVVCLRILVSVRLRGRPSREISSHRDRPEELEGRPINEPDIPKVTSATASPIG